MLPAHFLVAMRHCCVHRCNNASCFELWHMLQEKSFVAVFLVHLYLNSVLYADVFNSRKVCCHILFSTFVLFWGSFKWKLVAFNLEGKSDTWLLIDQWDWKCPLDVGKMNEWIWRAPRFQIKDFSFCLSLSPLHSVSHSGVCSADQGAKCLPGAAAGKGGGNLWAQSREEQHKGENGTSTHS